MPADVHDPAAALQLMETIRRDRVARVIAEGRRRGGAKTITNPLAVALRNLALRVVLARVAKTSGHSWIYDHGIDFAKPVNPSAQAARS